MVIERVRVTHLQYVVERPNPNSTRCPDDWFDSLRLRGKEVVTAQDRHRGARRCEVRTHTRPEVLVLIFSLEGLLDEEACCDAPCYFAPCRERARLSPRPPAGQAPNDHGTELRS